MMTLIAATLIGTLLHYPKSPDAAIARIRDRTILYGEIRCDRRALEENSGTAADDRMCQTSEQARLDQIMRTELLSAAAVITRIEPTDEDIHKYEIPLLHDDKEFAKYVDFSTAIPRATLRIHHGEDAGFVYDEMIRPLGISQASFDATARLFSSDEKIAAYFAADPAKQIRSNLRRNAYLAAVAEHLNKRWTAEAKQSGRDRAAVVSDFWNAVVRTTGSVILDADYNMINMGETK